MRLTTLASTALALATTALLVTAPVQPAQAASCTLRVGNVGYSAGAFFAAARLEGGCTGQVMVDLQLATSMSGPFETVETVATNPSSPDAPGGTAWFTDAYNAYGCVFFYRAVGTYAGLSDVSDVPRQPC
ncbi:hypothetical protein [Asanoa siamensis]|uniref:Secreted protein n=1 Tax=Asanoa siamensis TaxID=926357 RepID=A0ABQ4D1L3_9ACTN|nr:hypothetical protein [Asanoa siamensis]GIF77430.1 hypothetical protein Asi02nite_69480 [Asanoa siamensis]